MPDKKRKKRGYKKKPGEQREMANRRIGILFDMANEVFSKDKALANRYVTLARKISMKYKVRIPPELRRRFCRHCYKFLMPSVNCRVRLQGKKVVYYCFNCKRFMRIPYYKKKGER